VPTQTTEKRLGRNHCISCFVQPRKINMTITHMDVLRLGTNFTYMVRTLHGKSEEQMPTVSKAVAEHHCHCHDCCGDWCSQKKQTQQQKDDKKKHYRSKDKDCALCKEPQMHIERFIAAH